MEAAPIISKTSRYTAFSILLIGTTVFVWWFFANFSALEIAGLLLIFIGVSLSTTLIVLNIVIAVRQPSHKRKALTNTLLLLINLPLAIFYLWAALYVMNTERVLLVNKTGQQIEELRLGGCEEITVGTLQADESRRVWIKLNKECSIELSYRLNGKVHKEVINGYALPLMGQRYDYDIAP